MAKANYKHWLDVGAQLMRAQNYRLAAEAYLRAAQGNPRDAVARHDLAIAQIALEDYDAAALSLTEALRLRPDLIEAARQLCLWVERGKVRASTEIDKAGLKAALAFDTINRDVLCEFALRYLASKPPLHTALHPGRPHSLHDAALRLCRNATSDALTDELFKTALATAFIRAPELEHLLTAIRRVVLLELQPERFQDRSLVAFLIALARQCSLNEYVWAVSDEEELALAEMPANVDLALQGDAREGLRLLTALLYKPFEAILGSVSNEALKRVRPGTVRDLLVEQNAVATDLRARAKHIQSLAQITDQTSKAVAGLYERNPFPRWTSIGLLVDHATDAQTLVKPFGADKLAKLLAEPFEVLIAGCGTGLQAVMAAHRYGPNAKITAIDLSVASLAYAERMAEKFGFRNISFLQGDILDLGQRPDFANRFRIIECFGVLHHMEDPVQGLEAITACLAPSGLMLLALYSEIARSEWTKLKSEPDYPGPGCDDRTLRRYRQRLLARTTPHHGPWTVKLRDLHTMSGFRDLFLHPKEHRFTLAQIQGILQQSNLVFRGFFDTGAFARLQQRFADETWPGRLDRWAMFEDENRFYFAGMYSFWCGRAVDETSPVGPA